MRIDSLLRILESWAREMHDQYQDADLERRIRGVKDRIDAEGVEQGQPQEKDTR
jgi:hypothetical protein